MAQPIHILCIDDEPLVLKAYQRVFRDAASYNLTTVGDPLLYDLHQALDFDVIICDQRMPGVLGSDIFKQLCNMGYQGKKIICSAYADFNDIMLAFNKNHIDYFLNKSWNNNEIRNLIDNFNWPKMPATMAENQKIERVYELADKAAKTHISVYIKGETGTGKELLTRYIHDHSDRVNGPFITVNCATLTTELFESLMFGHKKGAFTGASDDHTGFYQAAHGGTLFLDEVVDIPLAAQAKILRALQEKSITRVGETHNIEVDVRVISASAKSMESEVKEGRFREDLMYRLNVYPIDIPPLRERSGEIEILFNHFLTKFNYHQDWPKIHYDNRVRDILLQYRWPGNIRELENLCNYLCATVDDARIREQDLPDYLLHAPVSDTTEHEPTQELDNLSIEQALIQCDDNKSQAAKLLGISRMTLWRHLKKNAMDS